ncbi:PREDICTED: uncharacterized protein LOC106741660 [Dinoponera quadriceps]|uniref:Uncharacterized protein LOC106741660 n=1 Tax=Dinoponera quadriceps TaxID=609295 RepID=A0A6P3WTA6_DINQU|nr:PREDICTED: uncharacterized protein LOC106741660 [Dinoponera quadriceps]
MAAVAEGKETVVQRGLSEWWSEETEYMIQRIERWTVFVRGYNRLRSQRWSKDQSKDRPQEHHRDSSWNVSSRKPSVDETTCTSRFCDTEWSRRKARPEETRINCCGTFNYQSSSELDSNCLETYRYDHSIYFKTIGDIRNDRREVGGRDVDRVSISSEELVEWDSSLLTDLLVNKPVVEDACNNNYLSNSTALDTVLETKTDRVTRNAWPIVDLTKLIDLSLTNTSRLSCPIDPGDRGRGGEQRENNSNVDNPEVEPPDPKTWREVKDREDGSKDHERMKRPRSFRKTRRSSRNARKAPIVGENNVVWPGVLLNYSNSFDVAASPPHEQ